MIVSNRLRASAAFNVASRRYFWHLLASAWFLLFLGYYLTGHHFPFISSPHSVSRLPPVPSESLRPLIVYAYAESDNARLNLDFFLKNGLHGNADFVFVFNGPSNMTDSIPEGPNISIVNRDNSCFDLGAIGQVLRRKGLWKNYKRFITLNASIRGPFLPVWSDACWSDIYLDRVTERVKLVGMSINCAGDLRPHVQSMIWATDNIGMGLLLDEDLATVGSADDIFGTKDDPVAFSGCYKDWNKAVHAEIGSTARITSQGYQVDALLTSLHSYDSVDAYCSAHSDIHDVFMDKGYFGTNVHPYETVFIKGNRGVETTLMDRFTEWQNGRKIDSYARCKSTRFV